MILTKYFIKKICKNQLFILILLFLVCFCQKLLKILGLNSNIPMHLVFLYLVLSFPDLGKLIIPFSLFLSVLVTFYRLHMCNEILAMYSCSVSKYMFIRAVLSYSSIVMLITFINIFYLSPYFEQCRNNILYEVKNNVHFIELTERKFQYFFDKQLVLFIDYINNKKLQYIFIAKKKRDRSNDILEVIIADYGELQYNLDHSQLVSLEKGNCYEIRSNQEKYIDICVISFAKYQMLINCNLKSSTYKNHIISCMSIKQLWNSSNVEASIEFNWRLTLLISIFIMSMIPLLLMRNVTYNYVLNFILAMILYVIFFILHIFLRFSAISMQIYPVMCMWLINLVYFIIICILNIWENFHLKIFNKIIFFLEFKK